MNALRTILFSLMYLVLPVAAQAYSLTWDNYSAPGVTFTPFGGGLTTSSQGGVGSLGVSGGVNGEISIGQSILISFDHAAVHRHTGAVAPVHQRQLRRPGRRDSRP